MKYIIKGKYQGKTEDLDEADDNITAAYLVGEYRMAFGVEWVIWSEEQE